MKVMITGSSGQIGKHLTAQLKNTAHNITALSHQELDITDANKTHDAMNIYLPDVVVNLAAYTSVELAENNIRKAFLVNEKGSENIAKESSKINAILIHLSTDYVFSGKKLSLYKETDTPDPINIYGKSKFAGELAIATHNPRHIILRTSWVFSDEGENFYKKILKVAEDESSISVVSDQMGGPTYAGDVAVAIIKMIDKIKHFLSTDWGVYHYSGEPYVSWLEFAQEIFKIHSNGEHKRLEVMAISSTEYPSKAKRPANSRLSNQKIVECLGVEPSNWRRALKDIRKP